MPTLGVALVKDEDVDDQRVCEVVVGGRRVGFTISHYPNRDSQDILRQEEYDVFFEDNELDLPDFLIPPMPEDSEIARVVQVIGDSIFPKKYITYFGKLSMGGQLYVFSSDSDVESGLGWDDVDLNEFG